jgi:hypothetical protein
LAKAFGQTGELRTTEENEQDHQDDDQLGHAEAEGSEEAGRNHDL